MSDVVLKIENISKLYRLGMVGTGTLSHDLTRWWHVARGKEDPYLKIGAENKREVKGESDYVWALKDISFEVKRGEVLGIIGKNGAGKSTLLKILSRVTSPTKGEFKVKGRIASLLEVGTGFHPELTGRENIFLNGAILGMTKPEIKKKFDEIVAFSGVERYIDTPVKRYSSGMYVRLAFAVAAHLEPEILIIDEVLAVGDAEFQKKCLGKMKDVAGEGRTVLFVSHNMTAVKTLCPSAILLQHGRLIKKSDASSVIDAYISEGTTSVLEKKWSIEEVPANQYSKLLSIKIDSPDLMANKRLTTESEIEIEFTIENIIPTDSMNVSAHFCDIGGAIAFASPSPPISCANERITFRCNIPARFLNAMMYRIDLGYVRNSKTVHIFNDVIQFEIHEADRDRNWYGKWPGVVRPILKWEVQIN
ncbi:MAG: ABC transporter ATP-binding protein [Bacteroidia bacterium]